jgi:hypothetical protein
VNGVGEADRFMQGPPTSLRVDNGEGWFIFY